MRWRRLATARAAPAVGRLLLDRTLDPLLLIEVVTAAGRVNATVAADRLLDLVSHPAPPVRAAALRSVRALDTQQFVQVLSTMDPDPHWSARAALASTLATLDAPVALPRLTAMLKDQDLRVIPSVLTALRTLKAPGVDQVLLQWLKHQDVVIRAAAATELGELKPAGGEAALVGAWRASAGDGEYMARGAIIDALAKYGRPAAEATLREGLTDKDFAVRVRSASLLGPMVPTEDTAAAIRPAPLRHPVDYYASPRLVAPDVSPHVYIDTDRGTIEIELAVLDAPLTCATFADAGAEGLLQRPPDSPRRAELRRAGRRPAWRRGGRTRLHDPRRVQRAAVPARDGRHGARLAPTRAAASSSSTHSPQPHLDARYTVFGQRRRRDGGVDAHAAVGRNQAVRVWDGKTMVGQE